MAVGRRDDMGSIGTWGSVTRDNGVDGFFMSTQHTTGTIWIKTGGDMVMLPLIRIGHQQAYGEDKLKIHFKS